MERQVYAVQNLEDIDPAAEKYRGSGEISGTREGDYDLIVIGFATNQRATGMIL